MSTTPKKSAGPTDLTADASFKAHEHPFTERDPVEDADHPPLSPYALVQGTREHHRQPVQASSSGRHEQPAAERRDETISDLDLERLEAILRSLQRQGAARRLPRASPLPPVTGLAPVDHHGRQRSADGELKHSLNGSSGHGCPWVNISLHRPGRKTMILKRLRRVRYPPSKPRRRRRRQCPRERPWPCHSRPGPGLSLRPRAKPFARLIRRSSSFSQDKASNWLRLAIWLRPGSYSSELRKPAMLALRWLWGRRTIPTCLQSSA